MKKPTVFISSTIYDFADLRSSLKYWLNQMGFNAQMSEYNDFQKDLTINSYDACLNSITQCDFFVLLLGTRQGGLYPGEDISITRKEYRTAYELAKSGKIKKLIVFIRQNVWDVREDRKSLHKLLHNITLLENGKSIDIKEISNYDSSILKNAAHIIDFIDEVTRKEDARNGNMPNMNWVHTFNTFEDVITTLKLELKISQDNSIQIAEQNIKMAIIYNLQKITNIDTSGKITASYISFDFVREKLKQFHNNKEVFSVDGLLSLTAEETRNITDFIFFHHVGVEALSSYEFENILSSGVFMDFDSNTCAPCYNNFCRMIRQLIEEINELKKSVKEFPFERKQKILTTIKSGGNQPSKFYNFTYLDLGYLCSIYERLINIQHISCYLMNCIHAHRKDLTVPIILRGFVDTNRPTEADLLSFFEN